MATLTEFKQFYQNNERYFEIAGEGVNEGNEFPPHRRIHQYVRQLKGKRVCDFGCGGAYDIERMYNIENRYVGLDVSSGALEGAKRRFSPSNVTYSLIDFDKPLPIPDASFDVVTSFFVFEHVLNPTRALDEMMRILVPKGELFMVTPNYGSPLKSAPPLGTPSKKKLLLKTLQVIKTMVRRRLRPKAALNLAMVPMDKIDVSGTWGPDMDATNEPWSWEIASYLRAYRYQVSSTSWEGQTKTKPEKIFERINNFPMVRDFGPLCFVHAVKS